MKKLRKNSKLLQIGKYYHPYKGGMESVLRALCEGLLNKIDLEVICSNDGFSYKKQVVNGVLVKRSPRFGVLFSQPLNLFFGIHFLRKFFRPKIVHIHSPNPLAEFLCIFLINKQIIVTHHSDIVRQKLIRILYLPVYKLLLKQAKYIIVPTQNHIDHSIVLKNYEHKCKIIPFGIKEDPFKITNDVQLEIDKLKNEKFVLFVGRLVGYKGVKYLVEAAQNISEKVYIVGTGPLENELKTYAQKLGVSEKIIFTGEIKDHAKFISLFHACKALVLPSISPNENFGIVQLEAMVCKKPIITTNIKSGVPCVAENGVSSILVTPESSKELSDAINKIFNDQSLSSEMGIAARKRFLELYTYDKMIQSHLDVYTSLSD